MRYRRQNLLGEQFGAPTVIPRNHINALEGITFAIGNLPEGPISATLDLTNPRQINLFKVEDGVSLRYGTVTLHPDSRDESRIIDTAEVVSIMAHNPHTGIRKLIISYCF